ncbi:peptide chain release factor N(5)-glutamine methyltransferase [Beijerinckiaceae bacterium]|nr:peptide chain release factor N(5)-glutamine methyltransferase [Beijerinckiaceae bacterium]
MTREGVRCKLTRVLSDGGIESANLDARVLLCAALGMDHATLVRDPDDPVGSAAPILAAFASRRLRREPVSRIIGHKEFWQACFKIGPAVLDPRPTTETLIEAVLDHAACFPRNKLRILDLGTGSGVILCTLLQTLPDSFGVGLDISPAACLIARDNLNALDLARRGFVVCGDWTEALRGPFDVIVSNPPYIARGDIAALLPEVRDHDPRLALDGGEDGLGAYRKIIPALVNLAAPCALIALELGAGQSQPVESFLVNAFGVPVEFRLDLDGHKRIILARLPSGARA